MNGPRGDYSSGTPGIGQVVSSAMEGSLSLSQAHFRGDAAGTNLLEKETQGALGIARKLAQAVCTLACKEGNWLG